MSLDFTRIKAIPIVEVVARYGIKLRFNGEWGSTQCPLPTHKSGDHDKNFNVNVAGNYWKCWSESCNENNGGKKGGDCINFVAAKEGISQYDAAKKLAAWFRLEDKEKPAPHIEKRAPEKVQKSNPQKDSPDSTSSSDSVKYMQAIDTWFDELFRRGENETDVDFWKRTRKGVKTKLVESYNAGKKAK